MGEVAQKFGNKCLVGLLLRVRKKMLVFLYIKSARSYFVYFALISVDFYWPILFVSDVDLDRFATGMYEIFLNFNKIIV